MARIAFFNERLPPDPDPISGFSYELIRSLADQQHEIRVFTTYRPNRELPPPHPRIQILQPFKNWSWLEIPRVIPILMEFRPEIIHVVESRAEALHGLTNAMSTLPTLAPLLNNPPIVTSFYDLRSDRLKKHRFLLYASDAVTVSNESQLRILNEFYSLSAKKPEVVLLPLPASLSHATEGQTPSSSILETLKDLASTRLLIFVPGDVEIHPDPVALFQALHSVLLRHPDAAVVIGGSWSGIPRRTRRDLMRIFEPTGDRVIFTGRLTETEEKQCLAHAKFVFLASLPPETLWLARLLRSAIETLTIPILNSDQAAVDSLSWRHRENAWITTANMKDWASSISEALSSTDVTEQMRALLSEFARREAIDHPSNVINRLYAGLLGRERQYSYQ